ncbi:uncharacterized protein LOC100679052 [Nasonia vitripennis]|uniref:Uncharacterized protein n=1 Tax=Nasonia vitripennis TaxID=7425 RepID=A0A7M7GBV6_NASVI|nr:uncharacterized protein LOC100679052 [Nasonia vitripennis]XP_008216364.1 uncharacterized protein LOC100679052 [Nasonia vitripennis]
MGHVDRTSLKKACLELNEARIRELIAEGANVNGSGHLASLVIVSLTIIQRRNEPGIARTARRLLRLLLDSGADLNRTCSSPQEEGNPTIFQTIVCYNLPYPDAAVNLPRIVLQHVAFIEATTERQIFNEVNSAYIQANAELFTFYTLCKAELTVMGSSRVFERLVHSVTYLELLTQTVRVVSRYTRSEEFRNIFLATYHIRFPVYASQLREKYDEADTRRQRMDRFTAVMSSAMNFDDNDFHDVLYDSFSEEEINNFIGDN